VTKTATAVQPEGSRLWAGSMRDLGSDIKYPLSSKEIGTNLQVDPHLCLGMPSSKPLRSVSRDTLVRL
jgi:hypothetical protein